MKNFINVELSGASIKESEFVYITTSRFSRNKNNLFKKHKGFFKNDIWNLRISNLLPFLRECRKNEFFLKLSPALSSELNVNSAGYSKKELFVRKNWLDNHPSNAKNDENFDEESLNLNGKLLGYQRAGVSYGISKDGRFLIADECGLGKTVQALAFAAYYRNDWPLLIVAPRSLLLNWKKEVEKWFANIIDPSDINVLSTSNKKIRGKIIIASYGVASKLKNKLENYIGVKGVMVVDECHNIKTFKSKTNQGIYLMSHFIKRVCLMSGTPFLNRTEELFGTLHCIDPIYWNDYYNFVYNYCDAEKSKFGLYVQGVSKPETLSKILRNNYMVRRLKKDVLSQLPPKRRSVIYLDVDDRFNKKVDVLVRNEELLILKTILNNVDVASARNEYFKLNSSTGDNSLFEAYEASGLSKIESLVELLVEKFNSHEKIIVYGHHDSFLTALEDRFVEEINKKSENLPSKEFISKIDGKSGTIAYKNSIVEKFQNVKKKQLLFLSIKAANAGLTLTESDYMIMGEFPWNYGISIQCEDRIHRIGQLRESEIIYPIADNSFDGYLWNLIVNKSNLSSDVLDMGMGSVMEHENASEDSFFSALFSEVYKKYKNGFFAEKDIVDAEIVYNNALDNAKNNSKNVSKGIPE